jgi:superfamily I DNA and RNA helicase
LRSNTNYRSPQDILNSLTNLIPLPHPIESRSPLTDSDVDIVTYADTSALIDQTKRAITQCIAKGFQRDMIAVVTFRGREKSGLTAYDKLGPFELIKFTGNYDLLGTPLFSKGDILFESVYRFKGQAAPCVILTEIDFEELDEITIRKLFVGATRATMKLILVMSEKSAQILIDKK